MIALAFILSAIQELGPLPSEKCCEQNYYLSRKHYTSLVREVAAITDWGGTIRWINKGRLDALQADCELANRYCDFWYAMWYVTWSPVVADPAERQQIRDYYAAMAVTALGWEAFDNPRAVPPIPPEQMPYGDGR